MKVKYVSLVCWLAIVHHCFAVPDEIPPDVFKTQRDGYLYADYPGVFDDPEGEGITIEAWIYLTDRPKDGDYWDTNEGRWLILGKPGSYHVAITGRHLGSPTERDAPEGFTRINFAIERAGRQFLGHIEYWASNRARRFPVAALGTLRASNCGTTGRHPQYSILRYHSIL